MKQLVAELTGVSPVTVLRVLAEARAGPVADPKPAGRTKRKIDDAVQPELVSFLREEMAREKRPTLAELRAVMEQRFNVKVGIATLSRTLHRLGFELDRPTKRRNNETV
jgi:transposase